MERGVEAVEGDVAVHHHHGLGGAVDRVDMNSAGGKRVDGEPPSIAEEVQDIAARGIAADKRAVFPLVEEKPGLLPFRPVDDKLVAVLQDGLLVVREVLGTVKVSVDKLKAGLVRRCPGTLVIDGLEAVAINDLQSLADLMPCPEHAYGMRLQHADSVVIVDDQARQPVALAVDEAVASGACPAVQSDGAPDLKGPAQHDLIEVRRQGGLVETEYPDRDGTHLVVSAAEETAVRGMHRHDVALGGMSRYLRDGTGKHPGMETQEGILPTFLQYDLDHWIRFLQGSGAAARESGDASPSGGA